jgi:site-specific DNA recombinase
MPGSSSAAALYLRSSKDRSDVSPAAQKRALEKLAASNSLSVARTYEDAVESGATADRPAFIELARDLKDRGRGWSYLLVYDTSRLARRRYIAQALKHEAKKRGVTILYATRPADVDPISEVVLDSMLEAMDEVHSLMSRQKGLAGMAENVRQGWRAGGRAPVGYQLKAFPTGSIREGKPVMKTKLELGELAPRIRDYLRARARGVPRVVAAKANEIRISAPSLIGVEWNALTYAGHTCWNVNREVGSGARRRPRTEWHIRRDTHPAMISDREAESILAQLETSTVAESVRRARAASSSFLLSGLLFSPDGRMWVGDGDTYRLRRRKDLPGRKVPAGEIEKAVLEQLRQITASDTFLEQLVEQSRQHHADSRPGADLELQIAKLERERSKAAERALQAEDGDVYARLVEQRGRQIEAVRRELDALRRELAAGEDIRRLTVTDVRKLLADQEPAKALRTLVERVMLDPRLNCQLQLSTERRPRRWLGVASPGGFEPPLPP